MGRLFCLSERFADAWVLSGYPSMVVQVLGISGSPVPNSNTDRAVNYILDHTGLETEFVKLSDLELQPCRACLGCVKSNQCVIDDDGRSLAEQFRQAVLRETGWKSASTGG